MRARPAVVVVLLFTTFVVVFDGEDGLAALTAARDVRDDVRGDTTPDSMSDCDWLASDTRRLGLRVLLDRRTTATASTTGVALFLCTVSPDALIVVTAGSVTVVVVGVSMEIETEFGDALDLALHRLIVTPFFPTLAPVAAVVARADFFFVTRVAGRLSDTVAAADVVLLLLLFVFELLVAADRVAARMFLLDPPDEDPGDDGADPSAAADDD